MTVGNQIFDNGLAVLSRKTEDSDCSKCNHELSSLQEAEDDRDLGKAGQICM